MFQQLSRAGLFFIVGLLVLVFVVTNPFSNTGDGCASSSAPGYAVRVYGRSITTGDFRAGLSLAALDISGGRTHRLPNAFAQQYNLRQHILDGFIDRSLLAREAEALGFSVEQDAVWEQLRKEGTALLSLGSDATELQVRREVPIPVNDENGNFSAEDAERVVKYGLNRSLGEFGEGQIQEHLAERMRQLIAASVHVSRAEMWDAYVRERDRAVISYVRFRNRYFSDQLEPSEETLSSFVDTHRETLEGQYGEQTARFTDLKRTIVARHILVRLEDGAGEEASAAAQARAEAILEKVNSSSEGFAALARRYSDDSLSARRGGRLEGPRPEALDTALEAMAVGDVSELVKSDRGLHILKVDAIREGTIEKKAALRELALDFYRQLEGRAQAEAKAKAFLEAVRGGTSFDAALAAADDQDGDSEGDEDPLLSNRPPLPDRPTVEQSRRVGRGGAPITGVNSAALLSAMFDTLTLENPLPDKPLDEGDEFIVYRLEERERPVEEDFNNFARTATLRSEKEREAITVYLHQLRQRAESEGAITINPAVLEYGSEDEP